jgi:hypothetical protein
MIGPPRRIYRVAAGASRSTVFGVSLIASLAFAAAPGRAKDGAPPSPSSNPGDSAAWSRTGGGVACIEYNLPKAGHVHVWVYDAAGHKVAHPVDQWQPAGRHITMFAFGPASNQVFRYRVQCGGRRSTGKIATGP